ncbi:hypothetical protein [Anabaena azotica]|uniref:hypothetical protein n=1 Tax=Anabaena azotica TaxID=197653 RepID=UPI0039A49F90
MAQFAVANDPLDAVLEFREKLKKWLAKNFTHLQPDLPIDRSLNFKYMLKVSLPNP